MKHVITERHTKWLTICLSFVIFHLSFSEAHAQVGEYRNDFAIGVNGGYMMSTIGFVPDVPQKQLGGITGGITLRYTCEKYFKSICAVVAEVNFAQTGWKEKILDVNNQPVYYVGDENRANPLYYERHMNYIQVPILARMGWGRERRGFQAFIQLGPQFGLFMSETTKTNLVKGQATQNQRSSTVLEQDTMAVQRRFDYGVAVGAGLEFSRPKLGHFIVEARYYYGLGDIYSNSKSDPFGRSSFGQIVIKATYLFDLIRTKNDKIK